MLSRQQVRARKQAEMALRESELRLALLVRAANVGLWDWDLRRQEVYFSPEWKQQLGYADHELPNLVETWRERLHPDDVVATVQSVEDRLAGLPGPEDREFRLRHRDGSWRWIYSRAEVTRDAQGQALRMMGSHIDITRLKTSEQALMDSEQLFKSAFESSAVGMSLVSCEGDWLMVNARACSMFGYSEAELLRKSFADITHPEDLADDLHQMARTVQGALSAYSLVKRYLHKDGHIVWGLLTVAPVLDAAGQARCLVTQVCDITEQKLAEQAVLDSQARLNEAAEHLRAILDNMVDGVLTFDEQGRIESFSRTAADIFGQAPEQMIGQPLQCLFPAGPKQASSAELIQALTAGSVQAGQQGLAREMTGLRLNGEQFPLQLSLSEIHRAGRRTFVALVRDITLERQRTEEIHRLAFFDPLTGLPNRRLLLDRLKQAMAASARSSQHGALMFLDLDHFKLLNDTRGHEVGDLLLQQVATRLAACVAVGDSVGRLGGDEFVLLLDARCALAQEAAGLAEQVAARVLAALAQPYVLRGQSYSCTPSIGIVLFMQGDTSVEELLRKADMAMYQAKAAGRNTARFYDPEMQAAAEARNELEADLRRALQAEEFELHYQRQFDAQSRVLGAEALVRWRHPQRGLVAPVQFIAVAEESALILPLGEWVLGAACHQLRAWAAQPATADWSLAVNVSARQFAQADFVASVLDALQRSGADPARLKLELTESMLVGDVDDVVAKMRALKDRGVGFALDDFGTGYSSLSYLKRLPLDQLKIDRSFVADLLTDSHDAAIARTILALGESLGLQVVAEGVETAGQHQQLLALGCQAFQGYWFGRPLPADQLLPEAQLSSD
ncbi:EAL domain-containing protein [Paucibacter sp. DJ4R-1]|nr:EAL domain-containing protein [Paucibacter sp. DJ4R-1]